VDLLAQMATFVRVVEAGSLSAAARAQRLSLPAVSRQLSALEDDLGVALLVRTTRRLSLTDAGRRWYERSLRVLREIDDARAAVDDARGVRGALTVSAPVTLGLTHLVPRLPALLEGHPGLTVELRLEDRVVDLVADAVDVVVRAGVPLPDSASLIAQPLLRFQRVAVAAPAYLRRRGVPREPAALAKHECLIQLGAAGPLSSWRFFRGDEEHTVEARGSLRVNAPLALLDAARAGVGIALLPDWLVAADLEARRLRRVLGPWRTAEVTAWALYRVEMRTSPRVRAFVDAVVRAGGAAL
jgi:DNA-binding transcriptional LysR family regulator